MIFASGVHCFSSYGSTDRENRAFMYFCATYELLLEVVQELFSIGNQLLFCTGSQEPISFYPACSSNVLLVLLKGGFL